MSFRRITSIKRRQVSSLTGSKQHLCELYRTLDPVALLAEMRDAQGELGTRIDRRAGKVAVPVEQRPPLPRTATFAKGLGKTVEAGEPRATHRRSGRDRHR
jgi:hypothetical protein